MEFCPKCGGVLTPQKVEGKSHLVCRRCGYRKEDVGGRSYRVREEVSREKREKLIVLEGARGREREKIEEERELLKEYYEIFLESMEGAESE